MSRLTTTDRWLLGALIPLWFVCISLHTAEVVRTGRAQVPVFAVPGVGANAYPVVGGLRIETDSRGTELRPGDELRRVGDVDLRGVGFVGFEALALEQVGSGSWTEVEFARGGQVRTTSLRPEPHAFAWSRIPASVLTVAICVLLLLRSPGSPRTQLFFLNWVAFSILQVPFLGGPRVQSYVAAAVWHLGVPICTVLMVRWATLFPDELPRSRRLSFAWSWGAGAFNALLHFNYFYGVPFPPRWMPSLSLATNAGLLALCTAILLRNYQRTDAVGQSRIKWVVFGGALGAGIVGVSQLFVVAYPQVPVFKELLGLSLFVAGLTPLGFLLAIVRYNLFDIDRLISATATYSMVLALGVATVLAIVPPVAAVVAEATGTAPVASQLALSLIVAGITVPAYRRLRPSLDRAFFPERLALARGVELLLRDLSDCRDPHEVLALVGDRLATLLRPLQCALYAGSVQAMELRFRHGGRRDPDLRASGWLLSYLESSPVPHRVSELRRATALSPDDERSLAALGCEVVLPIRCRKNLVAVVMLGERVSGDLYSRTDLTLLGAVAEKAGAELARLEGVVAIAAERTRAEQLERRKDQAEHESRAKSRFLAAVSHDLRQPLHALGFFADSLGQRAGDPESRELIDRIQTSTRALTEMFEQLLDLSRLDAGQVEPTLTDFEIGPLLDRLSAEAEGSAQEKQLALEVVKCSERVRSDPLLLSRILQNLLTNAVRYTERGGVTLDCVRQGSELEVRIADTGGGIPVARQREIFGEFVQLDAASGRGGLGLGLSIVERLARLLRHPVTVESQLGRGSVFSVRVPLGDSASHDPVTVAQGLGELAGRTILAVDDDLSVLEGMASCLRSWGCRVILADSLEAALEGVERSPQPPELVLADYHLGGGVTGLNVIDTLRSFLSRDLPCVVVSAETSPDLLRELNERGLPHLAKPVAPHRLRATLSEMLREGVQGP